MVQEMRVMSKISNDLARVIVKRIYPHLRVGVNEFLVRGMVQSDLILFMVSLLEKADLMTKANEVEDAAEEFDAHQFEDENPSRVIGIDLAKPGSDHTAEWLSKFPPKPDVGTYGGSISGDSIWIDGAGRPHFKGSDGWIEVRSFPPNIVGLTRVEVDYGGGAGLITARAAGVLWGRAKRFRFL